MIALTALLTLLIASGVASAQNERLLHSPVTIAVPDQPIEINVTVEGSEAPATEGRIYYRKPDQEAFGYVEMVVDQFELSGTIPPEDVEQDYLEYYIEVYLPGDLVLTYPEGAPDPTAPLQVAIRPIGAGESRAEKAVVVLSPEPGSRFEEGSVLIALTLMQHIRPMDPNALRIVLDGYDLTRQAQISEDMVALVAEGLKPGEHHASLYLVEGDVREKLVGWGFLISRPEAVQAAPGRVKGNVNTGYSHENISARIRNITYLDARANGACKRVDWAAKMYLTSLERGYLQSQHRFLASARYGALTVRAGDTQPRLSEFTLWGTRTRGAHIALRTPGFDMDVVWGFLRRSIEGAGGDTTIYVVDPATSDTLASEVDPAQDSIRVEKKVTVPGTYRRRMLAIRPGFRLARGVTLGLNILKAKDDVGSVEWGMGPKDNLVLGADLGMTFDHRRIVFKTETAVSLYNRDISSGAMTDAEDIDGLIVVNQFFEPLPTDSSILEEGISATELAKNIFGELVESALAHRTSLTLNYFKNELRLGYKSVGRSFTSLGSPTIQSDVKGFNIQDRFRLFKNRVYMTLGYEAYQDNVNGRSETTTDRSIVRSSIAYYSPPMYPNVSFGYRLHNRKNDGTIETIYNPTTGDSMDTIDSRIKNGSASFNFGVDHSFAFAGMQNSARLSITRSATEDQVSESGNTDTDLTGYSLSIGMRKGRKLENRAALRLTSQESMGGNFTTDYKVVSLSSRYMYLPERLWISGGFSITLAEGGNDFMSPFPDTTIYDPADIARSVVIDYSRMQFSVGTEFHLTRRHQFSLNAYKVIHTDDGSTVYWDEHTVNNSDAADFIRQEDFATRIKYSYNF